MVMIAPMAVDDDHPGVVVDWSAIDGHLYGRKDSLMQLEDSYDRCIDYQSGTESEVILIKRAVRR
jgi:hypothetical protein